MLSFSSFRPLAHSGFLLAELLVSMTLLSICLGAVFMTNVSGVQEVREMRQVFFAKNSLENMIKRIQGNTEPAALAVFQQSGESVTSNNPCSMNCSPTALASRNMFVWTRSITDRLDGVKYSVRIQNNTVRISLLWKSLSKTNQPVPKDCLFNNPGKDSVCITSTGFF